MPRKPSTQPANEATKPMKSASIRNRRTISEFSAPRHFIVPISRNRSETDISIELVMPTVQTSSAMTTSQIWRLKDVRVVRLPAKRVTPEKHRKAMPRKMPAPVIMERQKRIFSEFMAI